MAERAEVHAIEREQASYLLIAFIGVAYLMTGLGLAIVRIIKLMAFVAARFGR